MGLLCPEVWPGARGRYRGLADRAVLPYHWPSFARAPATAGCVHNLGTRAYGLELGATEALEVDLYQGSEIVPYCVLFRFRIQSFRS